HRHAPALPARHDALALPGNAHVGGHVLQAHQLQRAAGELEAVARTQAREETLLHAAETATAHQLHLHRAIAGDGADGQAVPLGDAAIADAIHALVVDHHARVFGIVLQRLPALHDEG